jgi:multiple sugar transport system permease protein
MNDLLPGGGEFRLYNVVNWIFARDFWPGFIQITAIDAFTPPQWLGTEATAKASIIAVHSWRILPFATVIFLAGIASIPTEVEDAAKVDGATGLKKFWYVSLPLQLPIATVAVLFGIIFTATDMTVVYILTHGGPFNSTHMLSTWAFDTGINSASLGPGAAIALYLLPILAAVAILMLRFARKVEVS